MKRITNIAALICICFLACITPKNANAQNKKPLNIPLYHDRPYHYGFILGYNQMLFSIDYIDNFQTNPHLPSELPSNISGIDYKLPFTVNDINVLMTNGFTVGIVGNLRLGKYFDLRLIPSLSFGERTIRYSIVQPDNSEVKTITSNTHSTFVEFPLQIKYRSKRNYNSAAYIIAGANYKIDMASQKNNYDDNNKPKNISTRRHDIAAEVGVGFDFYTGYFKLGVEVKMSYGLLDIAKDKDFMYSSSFDSLRNKCFQLSFTFE